jgi:integrase/recombinase XerD
MNDRLRTRIETLPRHDQPLVGEWLESFPVAGTQLGYLIEIEKLIGWMAEPLLSATPARLDTFAGWLKTSDRGANSQRRTLSAVRSFYKLMQERERLVKNPAVSLKLPRAKDSLAERIITEQEYFTLLAHEEVPRNKLLIELLYSTGGRIAESLAATWKNTAEHKDGGQVTYFGKGGKTRSVIIPAPVWIKLQSVRGEHGDDTPIFPSPKDPARPLSKSQAWRIVRQAALVAGMSKHVSPHWFRHAHASHAIDRGAPVSLVRDTLGHADLRTTSRYVHAKPDDSSGLYLSIK